MLTSTETALWNRGIISSLDETNAMVNPANYSMTTVTPLQLLGPLNDVERKYAPSKIFTAGPMKMPLPKPRVAIIGSRKASE